MSPWKKRERGLNARYEAGQKRVFHQSVVPKIRRDPRTNIEEIVFVGVTYYKAD